MATVLYQVVNIIAKLHSYILSLNDRYALWLTDKQLHFIVIGIIGMAILLLIYPLFQILSENHVLIIAWIYVFTVILVLTFAIEIGQGISHTGSMDFQDVVWGIAGFLFLFMIFAIIRMIFLGIIHLIKDLFNLDDDDEDDN